MSEESHGAYANGLLEGKEKGCELGIKRCYKEPLYDKRSAVEWAIYSETETIQEGIYDL